MKKPLLIGVSALALLTLSATLFAQTTTGTSLITEMKAAVRSFTLAADLNPGVTDLKSGPVSGKKTGDMLTAEEYNRILELVGQGGGGGAGGSTMSKIILANGSKQSTTGGTGSATLSDSASLTEKGLIVISGYASRTYSGSVANAGEYARIFVDDELCSVDMGFEGGTSNVTFHSSTSCVKMLEPGNHTVRFENVPSGPSRVMTTSMSWAVIAEKISSGSAPSSGGSGWVNVPLTDTANYDLACLYRYYTDFIVDDANRKGYDGTGAAFLMDGVSEKYLGAARNADGDYFGIPSATKGKYGYRTIAGVFSESTNVRVTKIEKLCNGIGNVVTTPPAT